MKIKIPFCVVLNKADLVNDTSNLNMRIDYAEKLFKSRCFTEDGILKHVGLSNFYLTNIITISASPLLRCFTTSSCPNDNSTDLLESHNCTVKEGILRFCRDCKEYTV